MLYKDQLSRHRERRINKLLCLFPYLLAEYLGFACKDDFSRLIPTHDYDEVINARNRPLLVATLLSLEVKSIPDNATVEQVFFSNRERLAMLVLVEKMSKCIGACERLVQTPVPLNYARHTSRFLTFWCLTLPLALVGDIGAAIIWVMALVSWGLFGIQEIGLMIEEPFRRSLDLDVIIRAIIDDIKDTRFLPEKRKRAESRADREAKRDLIVQVEEAVE
jgi:predicted membrane chloride channel (bestrophin family)